MILDVDFTLDFPPYEQIRSAIANAVRQQRLEPGARLPTVRQLARDLQLSPATVAHAYKELERDGVVYGAGRRGTFVADRIAAENRSLASLAREFVDRARRSGADRTRILHSVIDALADD